MITIKRTLSGKYQAVVPAGYNENGKRIIKHITKNTRKECVQAARELEQQLRAGGREIWPA